jgi:hypothetical protein
MWNGVDVRTGSGCGLLQGISRTWDAFLSEGYNKSCPLVMHQFLLAMNVR